MLYNFASSESSAGGIAAFGINWQSFVFQLITFLIIVWVLNKFVLKKLFAVIDERKKELDAGLERSEQAKIELANASAKADEILAEARVQAEDLIVQSHSEVAELISASEVKAAQKADRIVAEAKEQIKLESEKARKELKLETAKLVAKATEIVLSEKLTSDKDEKLIKSSLEGIK